MIPALIIWLCNKYAAGRANKKKTPSARVILLFLFTFFAGTVVAGERTFLIKRNGSVIGHMSFHIQENGDQLFLKMISKVHTRIVFPVRVETEDRAHFRNGRLIKSSTTRLVNGNEKALKETFLMNNNYETRTGGRTGRISGTIAYNMLLLYIREPLQDSLIYSDNFQCFVPIKKSGIHQYRIQLPDGNYNEYYFDRGICKRVVVHHTLYTISMERID
ncbi:hypothetical protein D9M68_626050 [compost metagenome]